MKTVILLAAAVTAAVVVGVSVDRETKSASTSKAKAAASAAPPLDTPPDGVVAGQVREAFDVAGYTYLRLAATDGSEVWAAVSKAKVEVGSRVTIADAARMTDFHSASLKRTFPVIYFGNLGGAGDPAAAALLPPGHPDIGAGHGSLSSTPPRSAGTSPHAGGSAAPESDAKVPKASGANARTIAELFAERGSLGGKQVRVQGRIVKATRVQGVTYYRLRDGSSTEPSNAELVVTSTAELSVGSVAVFEGAAGVDVDIGIGVRYPMMLQDARSLTPPS